LNRSTGIISGTSCRFRLGGCAPLVIIARGLGVGGTQQRF
jgi:hypothetical protein